MTTPVTPKNLAEPYFHPIPHQKARNQASTLYQIVKRNFGTAQAGDVKALLKRAPQASDPRPILYKAVQELQEIDSLAGSSILHEAVKQGKKSLVKLILAQGYDINSQNDLGATVLHLAISTNNLCMLKFLLKQNPQLLLENALDETAAELGLHSGHFSAVSQLLIPIDTLTQLVPQNRQLDFLAGLFKKGQFALLRTAIKVTNLVNSSSDFIIEWNFKKYDLSSISHWIKNPKQTGELRFILNSKEWNRLLFHFLGSKTLHFVKDRQHIRQGSTIAEMYLPLLWTWRVFCHHSGPTVNPILHSIDAAIAGAIAREVYPVRTEKLLSLIKIANCPHILPSGWDEHSIVVVFIDDYLFILNRGDGVPNNYPYLFVQRFNKQKLTKEILDTIIHTKSSPSSVRCQFLYEELSVRLDCFKDTFCEAIHNTTRTISCQKNENCVVAQLRLAIRALLLTTAKLKDGAWNFTTQEGLYKRFSLTSRLLVLEQFLKS